MGALSLPRTRGSSSTASPAGRAVVAALVLLAIGCDDTVIVELRTGPNAIAIDGTAVVVPPSLRDEETDTVATIACETASSCGIDDVACSAGLCDPAPSAILVVADEVLDLDALASDARSIVRQIDAIEVLSATSAVDESTLTFALGRTEILWSPEGGAEDGSDGALLGTLPPLASAETRTAEVELDPHAVRALSAYLVASSRRIRLILRAEVDLAPGARLPRGALRGSLDLEVRITGSVVR